MIEVDEVVRQAGEHMATKKNAKSAPKKAPSPKKKAAPEFTTPKKARPAVKRAATVKTRSKSALVTKLLDAAEKKVEADEVKASIGDVIRLLQLQKELEQEEPREITVQWISREGKKHVSEK